MLVLLGRGKNVGVERIKDEPPLPLGLQNAAAPENL